MRLFHGLERRIKFLIRTGSIDYSINFTKKPSEVRQFKYQGNYFYYRTGTSDVEVLASILLIPIKRSEYYVKGNFQTILDIGGNIGTSSIYFTHLFPNAKIYSFEPVKENYELLLKNTNLYNNICVFNFGLGSKNDEIPIFLSDATNKGGFSTHNKTGTTVENVSIRNVSTVLNELSLSTIDLIKIDTEGAEYDILTALSSDIISRTKYIIGEIHGIKDFELLSYLSQWFEIGVTKNIDKNLGFFRAINRNL